MACCIGAAMAIVAVVVFGAADRALFVPPPEVAAEEFVRGLTTERFELAQKRLTSAMQEEQTPDALGAAFETIRRDTGAINRVDATPTSADGDQASATANVEGDRGIVTLMLTLQREHGLWMVDSYAIAATRAQSPH